MAKKKRKSFSKRKKEAGKFVREFDYSQGDIITAYSKHFSLKKMKAVEELLELNVPLDPNRVERIREAYKRHKMKEAMKQGHYYEDDVDVIEQDETFVYIAGYTSGGIPFGITWEEMEEINSNTDQND